MSLKVTIEGQKCPLQFKMLCHVTADTATVAGWKDQNGDHGALLRFMR